MSKPIECEKLCNENQEYKYKIVEMREKIFQLEEQIKTN